MKKLQKLRLLILYKLIEWRFGFGALDWWVWNRTPFPFASPSKEQRKEAWKWVMTGKTPDHDWHDEQVNPNPPNSEANPY